MSFDLPDIIGILGSIIFLGTFTYANAAKELDKLLFNALNLTGAVLLLYSLWHKFNLAAFMLEVAWAVIALIGLLSALRAKARGTHDGAS